MKISLRRLGDGDRQVCPTLTRFAAAAILSAAAMAGCGGGGDDDAGDDTGDGGTGEVSFRRDIAPVFADKCNFCHHADSATEMDLTDPFGPEGFILRQSIAFKEYEDDQEFLVDPGNPEASFILTKVDGTQLDPKVEASPMPLVIEPLNQDELDLVAAWIEGGAQDDDSFTPVENIFGFQDQTLGRGFGKCTLCHYPDAPPPGLDILDVFGPDGLVDVPASLGGVRVVPGDVEQSFLMNKLTGDLAAGDGDEMPLVTEPMTPDEVADLRAWIAAGAQNN